MKPGVTREMIMEALFTKLQTAGVAFKHYSRRMKLWGEVADELKPSMIMTERPEGWVRTGEQNPGKTTLEVLLFIYIVDGKDPDATPIIRMNNLLDVVDTVLAPPPLEQNQTLGGLVSHCWIEGEIYKEPGDLDGDGIAIVPIKILVP